MSGMYDHHWRKRRDAQLRREPLCRICKAYGYVTPATVADHVVPHQGDPEKFRHGELQSLCDHCHNSIKQSLEKGGQVIGEDGWPMGDQFLPPDML